MRGRTSRVTADSGASFGEGTAAPRPKRADGHADYASGARLATLAYDPFGARRKADWTRSLNSSEIATLADDLKLKVSRGYSDHEHLDRAGFVHMNGRVYDPRTGRFLSPDPIVEDPAFSQSWHSYSYVANSPLSLADPTGLFAQCPIPTLGFSCDPAASPGGFGGAIDTVFSLIHRYWFDFYVYRAPSFSFAIGDEGIDVEFDVVDLIGVAVSVVSEIVKREVRAEGKGEADDPIRVGLIVAKTGGVGDDSFGSSTEEATQRRRAAEMVGVLQPFADAGDIFGFWRAARKYGDPLADLALEFHRTLYGDSLAARVGVSKLELASTGGDYRLSAEELGELKESVGIGLMRAHLESIKTDIGEIVGVPGVLSVDQIDDYHYDYFKDIGLPKRTYGGWGVPGFLYCPKCDPVSD